MISFTTIYNISVEIERKGIDFYEKLKDGTNDSIINSIIEDENDHIRRFNEIYDYMRDKVKEEAVPHFYMEEDMMVDAYASTEIFGNVNPEEMKKKDVYDVAIQMEKDSILFYTQMLDIFSGDIKGDKESEILKNLRKEEAGHLKKFVELKNRIGDV